MKTIILVTALFLSLICNAQTVFKNANNETCIELYKIHDDSHDFIIYMLADGLEKKDSIVLYKWDSLSYDQKRYQVQLWSMGGRAIEIARTDYLQMNAQKIQPFKNHNL